VAGARTNASVKATTILLPISAVVVAGCGGSSPPAGSSGSARPATASPTPNGAEAAVLDAYRAADRAYREAAGISDPNYPALESTHANPSLQQIRLTLITRNLNGIVGRGTVQLHPRVESLGPRSAVVVDCAYDGVQLVYKANGKVASDPGSAVTGYDAIRATLIETPSGWKESEADVRIGKCGPGLGA